MEDRMDGFWSFFAAVKERDDLYQELLDWLIENKIQIPLDLNKKIQKAYIRMDKIMHHMFDVYGKEAGENEWMNKK